MKTIAVVELAILLGASACGSARGAPPATDTGTGSVFAYSSRDQVKCTTVAMAAPDTTVYAQCAGFDDLPLAGSCSNPGPDLNVSLSVNGPVSWERSSGGNAGWLCAWVENGGNGQSVHVENATATMCCVVKSQ